MTRSSDLQALSCLRAFALLFFLPEDSSRRPPTARPSPPARLLQCDVLGEACHTLRHYPSRFPLLMALSAPNELFSPFIVYCLFLPVRLQLHKDQDLHLFFTSTSQLKQSPSWQILTGAYGMRVRDWMDGFVSYIFSINQNK